MHRLHKKNKRLSRYESISLRNEKTKSVLQGNGLYVYRNRSNHATLTLPKKCKDGRVEIPPNGEFEGDDYFDMLVKNNMAVKVRTVEEVLSVEVLSEEKKGEDMLVENKLILDQPETVTTKGTVEHVVVDSETKKKKTKKNEAVENVEKVDVLLTDSALDGIQILG